jgi:hypothetical protein
MNLEQHYALEQQQWFDHVGYSDNYIYHMN